MKRWAIIVAGLYFLILATLTIPVCAAAFYRADMTGADVIKLYMYWPYWSWLAVMALAQAALLVVPVRVASRRPVSRRSLLPTVLASGLMMGGLVAGAICALYEFFLPNKGVAEWGGWSVLGLMVLTWAVWSLVFFRLGRQADAKDWVTRQCRRLLQGSILELLVAVPTHIVARHRDYCCAGFLTFIGLTMGISVMLFSFGPAVFFLFIARWQRLHPAPADAHS